MSNKKNLILLSLCVCVCVCVMSLTVTIKDSFLNVLTVSAILFPRIYWKIVAYFSLGYSVVVKNVGLESVWNLNGVLARYYLCIFEIIEVFGFSFLIQNVTDNVIKNGGCLGRLTLHNTYKVFRWGLVHSRWYGHSPLEYHLSLEHS